MQKQRTQLATLQIFKIKLFRELGIQKYCNLTNLWKNCSHPSVWELRKKTFTQHESIANLQNVYIPFHYKKVDVAFCLEALMTQVEVQWCLVCHAMSLSMLTKMSYWRARLLSGSWRWWSLCFGEGQVQADAHWKWFSQGKPLQHDLMDKGSPTNTLTIKVLSQLGSPGKAILNDRTVSEGSFYHWKGLVLYSFY